MSQAICELTSRRTIPGPHQRTWVSGLPASSVARSARCGDSGSIPPSWNNSGVDGGRTSVSVIRAKVQVSVGSSASLTATPNQQLNADDHRPSRLETPGRNRQQSLKVNCATAPSAGSRMSPTTISGGENLRHQRKYNGQRHAACAGHAASRRQTRSNGERPGLATIEGEAVLPPTLARCLAPGHDAFRRTLERGGGERPSASESSSLSGMYLFLQKLPRPADPDEFAVPVVRLGTVRG